jgi:D-threo-aldose 1-dehydrogenase
LATGARADASYDYRPAPPPILDKVGRIEAVCARHQVDLTTAALQFPLAHPRIASIVVGALRPSEVEDNLARLARAIPAELWRELKAEGLLVEAAPVPA